LLTAEKLVTAKDAKEAAKDAKKGWAGAGPDFPFLAWFVNSMPALR
jgi:hypothetical protein